VSGHLHAPVALHRGNSSRARCIGGWVDPRAGPADVGKRKFLTLPELELQSLGRPARRQSLYRLSYPSSFSLDTDSVTNYQPDIKVDVTPVPASKFFSQLLVLSLCRFVIRPPFFAIRESNACAADKIIFAASTYFVFFLCCPSCMFVNPCYPVPRYWTT
jgi:hypothetical protein